MCLGNSTDLENAGGGVEKKKSVNKKCGGQRHVYVCGGSMKRQRGSEAARWPVSESVGERVRARQRDGPGRPGQGGGLGGGSRNGLGSRVAGLRPGRHSHSGTLLGGGPFALWATSTTTPLQACCRPTTRRKRAGTGTMHHAFVLCGHGAWRAGINSGR